MSKELQNPEFRPDAWNVDLLLTHFRREPKGTYHEQVALLYRSPPLQSVRAKISFANERVRTGYLDSQVEYEVVTYTPRTAGND